MDTLADKARLISLLKSFGIDESQSLHDGDSFVVRDNDVFVDSDGRLRRVAFLFNDDDSFNSLG